MPNLGLNRVLLIGHVVSEPRYKITQQHQRPRLWLRVQTTEGYRDQHDIERERRSFHTVVVWGKHATALSAFLREGQAVAVEGRLSSRSYDSKGQKRYEVEVTATKLVVLTPANAQAPADLDAA